jgi:hypothetical protein
MLIQENIEKEKFEAKRNSEIEAKKRNSEIKK